MVSIALDRPVVDAHAEVADPGARGAGWFSDLYRATADRVYRFAHVFTHDHYLAEDVVAETYLRIWRARQRFDPSRSELAWVMAIARNCAIDVIRERRGELVGVERAGSIEDKSFDFSVDRLSPEQLETLREALGQLTVEQQQVIFLRFFEGMEHERVATQMGKKPNAVRAIQFRALNRLRTILGGQGA